MENLSFYFDGTRCIGCRACQIACKDKNRIMEPGITFRTVYSYEEGAFPDPHVYHVAATCNHCGAPACVANCPTGAMYKEEEGTVQHDDETCIGCKACIESCPYGVPQYFEDKQITGKCDACIAFRQHDKNPVCVDACIMRALDFDTTKVLQEKYGSDLVSDLPSLPDGGTEPHVYIKRKDSMMEESFSPIII